MYPCARVRFGWIADLRQPRGERLGRTIAAIREMESNSRRSNESVRSRVARPIRSSTLGNLERSEILPEVCLGLLIRIAKAEAFGWPAYILRTRKDFLKLLRREPPSEGVEFKTRHQTRRRSQQPDGDGIINRIIIGDVAGEISLVFERGHQSSSARLRRPLAR